jgi:hypothetical protein
MARFTDTDRFDDEDDITSGHGREAKGGFPVWAMVVLCAVPIFAVVAIGGAVAMFTMRSAHVERAEAQANLAATRPAINRVCTRDEVKALVGSTPEDVTAAIGPPSFRLEGGARSTWHFHNMSRDPVTGRVDPITKVVFDGGVVVEVNF